MTVPRLILVSQPACLQPCGGCHGDGVFGRHLWGPCPGEPSLCPGTMGPRRTVVCLARFNDLRGHPPGRRSPCLLGMSRSFPELLTLGSLASDDTCVFHSRGRNCSDFATVGQRWTLRVAQWRPVWVRFVQRVQSQPAHHLCPGKHTHPLGLHCLPPCSPHCRLCAGCGGGLVPGAVKLPLCHLCPGGGGGRRADGGREGLLADCASTNSLLAAGHGARPASRGHGPPCWSSTSQPLVQPQPGVPFFLRGLSPSPVPPEDPRGPHLCLTPTPAICRPPEQLLPVSTADI